jgi:hypothetical protein
MPPPELVEQVEKKLPPSLGERRLLLWQLAAQCPSLMLAKYSLECIRQWDDDAGSPPVNAIVVSKGNGARRRYCDERAVAVGDLDLRRKVVFLNIHRRQYPILAPASGPQQTNPRCQVSGRLDYGGALPPHRLRRVIGHKPDVTTLHEFGKIRNPCNLDRIGDFWRR